MQTLLAHNASCEGLWWKQSPRWEAHPIAQLKFPWSEYFVTSYRPRAASDLVFRHDRSCFLITYSSHQRSDLHLWDMQKECTHWNTWMSSWQDRINWPSQNDGGSPMDGNISIQSILAGRISEFRLPPASDAPSAATTRLKVSRD